MKGKGYDTNITEYIKNKNVTYQIKIYMRAKCEKICVRACVDLIEGGV